MRLDKVNDITVILESRSLQAGLTKKGEPKNAEEILICDIGDRQFEMLCPGTAYVTTSRGTTIGDSEGKGSAIYFQDNCISKHRLMNMSITDKNAIALKVRRRNAYYAKLRMSANNASTKLTTEQKIQTIKWIYKTRTNKKEVEKRIRSMRNQTIIV